MFVFSKVSYRLILFLFATALCTLKAADLSNFQDGFAGVSEKVIPSVTVITNLQKHKQINSNLPPDLLRFFGIPQPQVKRNNNSKPVPAGKGSGVIFKKNGYIITNYHVVKDADFLEVKLNDGTIYNNYEDKEAVKLVGTDEETDLAVLKIKTEEDLPAVEFADSDKIRVGEWAIAVGAPFSLDYSVTVGVVSQKGRYDVNMNAIEDYIQTDASINPGNSGGPLLNIKGQVIGINDFIFTGGMTKGSIGLGFAISSNLAQKVAESLISDGKVVRPWLGIAMAPLTPELRKTLDIEKGVFISEVVKGEPADDAGVEPGDVVLKVGDKEVETIHQLKFAVLDYKAGSKIKLTINRDGDIEKIYVTARARNGSETDPAGLNDSDILENLGLTLEEEDDEVFISQVIRGSAAHQAGLRRGAKILKVNRTEIEEIEDVVDTLSKTKAGQALFYVEYRNRIWYTAVKIN